MDPSHPTNDIVNGGPGGREEIPLILMEEGSQPNNNLEEEKAMMEEEAMDVFPYSHRLVYDTIPGSTPRAALQIMQKEVTFNRSQSLPHLSVENIGGRRRYTNRIRYFSGRASHVTLERMRNISTRTFSAIDPSDENQDRGNWTNPIEFFLSCLGYAVGLGNVWRFPYLCFENGGGAFLIPYFLMLFGCGLPLLFLELSLGQYSSQGPLTVWSLCPIFKGVGIGMVICSIVVAVYYNMITGWALHYLLVSIREVLPWSCCAGQWASAECVSFLTETRVCQDMAAEYRERTGIGVGNATNLTYSSKDMFRNGSKLKFAADDYFHRQFLGISSGLNEIGGIKWELVVSLMAAWLIVFAVLMKGIKSFGKAVYFTSTFPYLILLILLIRAMIEDGAMDGILFYLTPKWEKLGEAKVWGDAASQIFYSTGVCMGGSITLASYNKFRNNLYRDAVIVALGNSATSVFSGFVVFSILGFMAKSQNTTVENVVAGGPGLTFIAYPQAVTLLPVSPLWSCLFFVMLVTLALSTMFPTTENIATAVIDQFPDTLRPYKFFVLGGVCFGAFLLGLPLTTNGGMYVLTLMDSYGVAYALLILGLFEVTIIAWRYGAGRLLYNIQAMIGYRPSFLWKYIWVAITPSLLIFALFFTFAHFESAKYRGYIFPSWADCLGFSLTSISILPIPIYALYAIVDHMRNNRDSSFETCIRTLTTPHPDWGPALQQNRGAGLEPGDDDVFS